LVALIRPILAEKQSRAAGGIAGMPRLCRLAGGDLRGDHLFGRSISTSGRRSNAAGIYPPTRSGSGAIARCSGPSNTRQRRPRADRGGSRSLQHSGPLHIADPGPIALPAASRPGSSDGRSGPLASKSTRTARTRLLGSVVEAGFGLRRHDHLPIGHSAICRLSLRCAGKRMPMNRQPGENDRGDECAVARSTIPPAPSYQLCDHADLPVPSARSCDLGHSLNSRVPPSILPCLQLFIIRSICLTLLPRSQSSYAYYFYFATLHDRLSCDQPPNAIITQQLPLLNEAR